MKNIFMIQEVRTKEYLDFHRGNIYFTPNINKASQFNSKITSMNMLKSDIMQKFCKTKILKIKKFIII